MCDYSLEHLASRPAAVGDTLVTTSFRSSFTRGFAAEKEPHVAVCVLPGTEIAFEHDVEYDHFLAIFRNRKVGATVARFRRINPEKPHEHHDALEFPNGKVVMLTQLSNGQRARVLQLPAEARPEAEAPRKTAGEIIAAERETLVRVP